MNLKEEIQNKLKERARENIKVYNKRIIPSAYPFVGVAIPDIRKIAKEYKDRAQEAFEIIEPDSFESVLLKGFMLGYVDGDFERLWQGVKQYLGLCDNWAHIDCFFSGFRSCKKYTDKFDAEFRGFVADDRVFFRRAVAVFNMNFRLTDEHIEEALNTFYALKSGDYYVDMAIAWGLTTAFIKHYDRSCNFVRGHRFSDEIRKMTTAKCRDSFRLTDNQKEDIKELLK